jgi:ADP-ribosyl-[dinitrogen reductase] hydrolase
LGAILFRALDGQPKDQVLFGDYGASRPSRRLVPRIGAIARGDYQHKTESQIRGDGYVVNSLEAALWSFLTTDDFSGAVLQAVNLGDDADTTAAVCGQVAGAYYGENGIPAACLDKLAMRSEIGELAELLFNNSPHESAP